MCPESYFAEYDYELGVWSDNISQETEEDRTFVNNLASGLYD